MKEKSLKLLLKRFWRFFWYEDSLASWLVNIIIAFVVIKFLVYPGLGLLLGTPLPIVAVMSESMEHGLHQGALCGQQYQEFPESFEKYWKACGGWYETQGISQEKFSKFPFPQGFNKGDVIILWRANSNVKVGDILVFQGNLPQPIIHRVVKIWEQDGKKHYQTKGDHNLESLDGHLGRTDERDITQDRVYGKGAVRIPYLGWLKIIFVEIARMFGVTISR